MSDRFDKDAEKLVEWMKGHDYDSLDEFKAVFASALREESANTWELAATALEAHAAAIRERMREKTGGEEAIYRGFAELIEHRAEFFRYRAGLVRMTV